MSSVPTSSDDCYFFFYGTCAKGDSCPFRHSPAALGSEVVCAFWREGKCIKGVNCKYRHMETRKLRNKVECFFEKQPGGCKKPYCPFLHNKSLNKTDEPEDAINKSTEALPSPSDPLYHTKPGKGLLGESDGLPSPADANHSTGLTLSASSSISPKHLTTPPFSPTNRQPASPSLATAVSMISESMSFNIDMAEESENEPEEQSSPEKKPRQDQPHNHETKENFGVKTLEQIRMEKLFKTNDIDKSPHIETTNNNAKASRIKLKRKSTITNDQPTQPNVPIKDNHTGNMSSISTFGIKSLDEIRREKREQSSEERTLESSNEAGSSDQKKVVRIKRTHLGLPKQNSNSNNQPQQHQQLLQHQQLAQEQPKNEQQPTYQLMESCRLSEQPRVQFNESFKIAKSSLNKMSESLNASSNLITANNTNSDSMDYESDSTIISNSDCLKTTTNDEDSFQQEVSQSQDGLLDYEDSPKNKDEDDLLKDILDDNDTVPDGDVNIEDEDDDEFLKEIEHVINS